MFKGLFSGRSQTGAFDFADTKRDSEDMYEYENTKNKDSDYDSDGKSNGNDDDDSDDNKERAERSKQLIRSLLWMTILLVCLFLTVILVVNFRNIEPEDIDSSKDQDSLPPQTFYSATYRIDWFTKSQECYYDRNSAENSRPTSSGVTATCIKGEAVLLTPSTTFSSLGACEQISPQEIFCQETTTLIGSNNNNINNNPEEMDIFGRYDTTSNHVVQVLCYANTKDDLKLKIELHGASYRCNSILQQNQTDTETITEYGGSVQRGLQVASLCSDDRWMAVRSAYLNDENVAIDPQQALSRVPPCSGVVLSHPDGLDICSIDNSCEHVQICDAEFFPDGCGGEEYCDTVVGELEWTVLSLPTCTSEFTSMLPVGAPCLVAANCESSICIGAGSTSGGTGVCSKERLSDGRYGCTHHSDCTSGACAAESIPDTGIINNLKVCCTGGLIFWDASGPVCGNQPPGAACLYGQDEMCENIRNDEQAVYAEGFCISGVCEAGPQEDTMPCENDRHCWSGACGIWTNGSPACCPSGMVSENNDVLYCTDFPMATFCEDDSMCGGGGDGDDTTDGVGACALEIYEFAADRICCDSGASIEVIRPDSNIETDFYCSGLLNYEVCGDDAMCFSGACGFLNYTDTTVNTLARQVCCPSGESVTATQPGTIFATSKYCTGQPTGGVCGNDEMCMSRTCARASYSVNTDYVCCNGGKVSLLKPDDPYTSDNYCTGLPVGAACGDDIMCSDNLICQNGVCMEGQPVADSRLCETSDDCDGEPSACALRYYDDLAPKTCCPSGQQVTFTAPDEPTEIESYCSELDAFVLCGAHEMCAGGACGRLNYTSDDTRVCCPSNDSIEAIRPDRTFEVADFCTGQPVGSVCGGNDGMCDGPQPSCGRADYTSSADYVCCAGEKVKLFRPGNSFSTDHYCTKLPLGSICGSDIMCASGICVQGLCTDAYQEELEILEECLHHAMCENKACGRLDYATGETTRVCCPSGDTVESLEPNSAIQQGLFCTNQPIGSPCGNDNMCTPVNDNRACARSDYSLSASLVCCPGGDKVRLIQPGATFTTDFYCTGLTEGSPCGDDSQCESLVCEYGTCST